MKDKIFIQFSKKTKLFEKILNRKRRENNFEKLVFYCIFRRFRYCEIKSFVL